MGNTCRWKSAGIDDSQRAAAARKYKLTDNQVSRVEELFMESSTNNRYLTLKDFRDLYSASRFEHDEADIAAVFRALSLQTERISFDGFVRLTLLCAEKPGPDAVDAAGSKGYAANGSSHGNGVGSEDVDNDKMQVLFNVMDCDGSGTISESELHRFLLNFVDDKTTADGFFLKLDHDNSRAIDFKEFAAFCRCHRRVFRAMCSYVFPVV